MMKKDHIGIIGIAVVLALFGAYTGILDFDLPFSTYIGTKTLTATSGNCQGSVPVWIYKHEGSPEYIYLQTACDSAGSHTPLDFDFKKSTYMSYEICSAPKYYTPGGLVMYHMGNDGEGRGCGQSTSEEYAFTPVIDSDAKCITRTPQAWLDSDGSIYYSSGICQAAASCSDGIQNQGETGIDCGGPCQPCGAPPAELPAWLVPFALMAALIGLSALAWKKWR